MQYTVGKMTYIQICYNYSAYFVVFCALSPEVCTWLFSVRKMTTIVAAYGLYIVRAAVQNLMLNTIYIVAYFTF